MCLDQSRGVYVCMKEWANRWSSHSPCCCAVCVPQLCRSAIDVEVSGSTGIISFLRGNKLFVANVGDSRAVLGRVNDKGQIRAVDLSHDQKPDRCVCVVAPLPFAPRLPSPPVPHHVGLIDCGGCDVALHSPDEKARIIAHGGRVFEWGVPRVWLRDVDMPGLAMARSFGDMAAETVGVFAEPELSKVTLTSDHRFVIWASDGTSRVFNALCAVACFLPACSDQVRLHHALCFVFCFCFCVLGFHRSVGVYFFPGSVLHCEQVLVAGPSQGVRCACGGVGEAMEPGRGRSG